MIQLTHIQDWFYITVSTDLTGNQGLCDDPARAGFKRSFFRQLGGYL